MRIIGQLVREWFDKGFKLQASGLLLVCTKLLEDCSLQPSVFLMERRINSNRILL